jgi:hypothetical protein
VPSSSAQPQRELAQRVRVAPEEVTLFVWPLRQQPLGSLAALAAAAGMSWLVGWSLAQPWWGAAAAGGLAVALWRTWLPVTFEIGVAGVTQVILGRRRRIGWPAIRGWQVRGGGVLLVPDVRVTPLAPLRGLYLPWLNQRDKVLANVEYYLAGRGGPT